MSSSSGIRETGIEVGSDNHSATSISGRWKRACSNQGIEGVDLYGGTRHSSATALQEHFSPEEIKEATMHATNTAFQRYFRTDIRRLKAVYEKAGGVKNERKEAGNAGLRQ